MKVLSEHQVGNVSLENVSEVIPMISGGKIVDAELRTAEDGRIWINVNGISFFRFMPMERKVKDDSR